MHKNFPSSILTKLVRNTTVQVFLLRRRQNLDKQHFNYVLPPVEPASIDYSTWMELELRVFLWCA